MAEKMNPMIGTPIIKAAIALMTAPTWSKKSRRVE
jgi:hypothetical protein